MSILRFLPGIIIIQVATAVLIYAFIETPGADWLPYFLLALIASLLAAFWLSSIANHIKKDALTRLKDELVREREQLLITAEKEKNRVFKQTHQRMAKETNRAHAKANFKTGAAIAGVVSVGIGLLSIQFFTIGLLALLAAGGALTGYAMRVRQNILANRGKITKNILTRPKSTELIETKALRHKRVSE